MCACRSIVAYSGACAVREYASSRDCDWDASVRLLNCKL